MNLVSIRGAITVEDNTSDSILSNTKLLLKEMERKNKIDRSQVVNIIFTATKDLDTVYPARAARELGYLQAALLCFQEMYVVGSLKKCIRVNILIQSKLEQDSVQHVYLKGAKVLRPDLGGLR